MPRIRRGRYLRHLIYLLSLCSLFYIYLQYNTQLLKPATPVAQYSSRPTYEYTSLYRTNSNSTFEDVLDVQLLLLEQSLRSSLPPHEQALIANRTIWQITTPKEAETGALWVSQWRDNNQEWFYHLYTSPPIELLQLLSTIPEIATAYQAFPAIREDLLKYILLWYYGGFYTEIDTWARQAMRDCQPIISVVEGQRNISLMVGVDIDEPYLSQNTIKQWGWARGFSFGQYVIWAPKRFDPILRKAIVRAISHGKTQKSLASRTWMNRYRSWRTQSRIEYMEELSGAGMFTDLVLDMLSQSLKDGHRLRDRDAGLERRVTWKKFRASKSIIWVETDEIREGSENKMRGLAVVPINVWGSGQTHSGSGTTEAEDACVNHVHGRRPRREWA
jgi:mannosyltransferase OCH1-like enzyme